MSSAIILLSGGLDSLVALDMISAKYDKIFALFFNYGQKAYKEELTAVKNIAKRYNIEFEEIRLPYLENIAKNSLVDDDKTNFNDLKSVWVPNRNGLFLNIAACYCDKFEIDYIIFGANKEEAQKFPDNSKEFIENSNAFFEYSTIVKPKIIAPCLEFDKIDIINYAIDNKLSFKVLKSCYQSKKISGKKHCGECMSCKYLKSALLKSKKPELIKEVF